MKGIISKPAFDKDVFKPGMAIRVNDRSRRLYESHNRYGLTVFNALIKEVNGDTFKIVFVDGLHADYRLLTGVVTAESVSNGEVEIEFLEKEEENREG